jgi:hypothetical protein
MGSIGGVLCKNLVSSANIEHNSAGGSIPNAQIRGRNVLLLNQYVDQTLFSAFD